MCEPRHSRKMHISSTLRPTLEVFYALHHFFGTQSKMPPKFVYVVSVFVFFGILLQVHRVSTMECGTVNFVRPAMWGGTETVKGEWPFVAAIRVRSNYICGGTIISVRHILTAAHCVHRKEREYELSPHEIVVRLGAHNLTDTNEKGLIERNVSAIFVHHDWAPFEKRFDADIAILVLSENVTFTDDIQPVCMPSNGIAENMDGSVVGYDVRESTIHAEIPKRIFVKTVNSSHCFREDDVVRSFSSQRTFCGGNGDGSPDLGDSGSGYFFAPSLSWAQFGIVAVLRTSATGHVFPHAYQIYTNVTMYKDWITKIVNETGGVVGEASTIVNMNCRYGYNESTFSSTPIYICSLYDISIQGDNLETGPFVGSHLSEKTQQDVEAIHFVNGTMSHLPSGFGLFFKNVQHLTVGRPMTDSVSLGTNVVRRSDLRNLRNLVSLSFFRNDIETLREDALWDLPKLRAIEFVDGKLKMLYDQTFSKNSELQKVVFTSNQLHFLPANLFLNNPLLSAVDFENNFLKAIDETIFATNGMLRSVYFNSNQLEMLPKRLFQNNSLLRVADFANNSLSSVDEDLFETNVKLTLTNFASNEISSLPPTLFRNAVRVATVHLENDSERLNMIRNNSILDSLDLSNGTLNNVNIDAWGNGDIYFLELRPKNSTCNTLDLTDFTRDDLFGNPEKLKQQAEANCD